MTRGVREHWVCTVEGCGRPHASRGLCGRHYQRLRNTGSLNLPTPAERFWSKVDQRGDQECWPWLGATDSHGYGQHRNRGAHRVAYELTNGPVPEGHELDHLCHTNDRACSGGRMCEHRACVNPAHLEPVTPTENQRRSRASFSGINFAKTHCKRGHQFTEDNTRLNKQGKRVCKTCERIRRLPDYIDTNAQRKESA